MSEYNQTKMISRGATWAVFAFALAASVRPSQAMMQTGESRPPLVDINAASIDRLRAALSISSEKAGQIVAHRPYQSVEQFKTKSGLAPGEAGRLAPLVTVQAPEAGRQPRLPPGAVPISPESFRKEFSTAPSESPHAVPGLRESVTVPPGTVQRVPVPSGIVRRNIPVPGPPVRTPVPPGAGLPGAGLPGAQVLPGQPAPGQTRDLRAGFVYGLTAVVVSIAALIYMRRTSPKRRTRQS